MIGLYYVHISYLIKQVRIESQKGQEQPFYWGAVLVQDDPVFNMEQLHQLASSELSGKNVHVMNINNVGGGAKAERIDEHMSSTQWCCRMKKRENQQSLAHPMVLWDEEVRKLDKIQQDGVDDDFDNVDDVGVDAKGACDKVLGYRGVFDIPKSKYPGASHALA